MARPSASIGDGVDVRSFIPGHLVDMIGCRLDAPDANEYLGEGQAASPRTILVTGANRGLGVATAGHRLLLTARDDAKGVNGGALVVALAALRSALRSAVVACNRGIDPVSSQPWARFLGSRAWS